MYLTGNIWCCTSTSMCIKKFEPSIWLLIRSTTHHWGQYLFGMVLTVEVAWGFGPARVIMVAYGGWVRIPKLSLKNSINTWTWLLVLAYCQFHLVMPYCLQTALIHSINGKPLEIKLASFGPPMLHLQLENVHRFMFTLLRIRILGYQPRSASVVHDTSQLVYSFVLQMGWAYKK